MNKYSENIDFSIIWKKMYASLTENEEIQLQRWLAENEEHQAYFDKVIDYYQNGSKFEDTAELTEKGWPALSSKINFSKKPKRKNRFLVYAVSMAASIVLFLAVLAVIKPDLFQNDNQIQIAETITPGSEKAILLMEDGTSYDLSSGKNLSLEVGGAEISSQGTSLRYNSENAEGKQVKYNTLVIPRGGQFNLTLSDGTQVWLNAGSTLKYPTAFVGKERNVELTGEAYFEVKRDENKPFKVISGEQVVQVLGTSFNVSSYQEEPTVFTTLVEGKVNVYLDNDPQNHQILSPNQQSVLEKGENSLLKREVDVAEYISWKDGWFYFKEKPLETIVADLSRWYDVSFQFDNQGAKKLPFTGKIRRYEDLEDILKLLEKTKEVQFKIERRKVIIK
ncbi:DUF4974 domain-containing protein [Echinicola jeungdonensis]|uniref:FecR family protein n=1 Tax=Echinicola jeungdonensis TaxID=709343 RepID=A0ABV5J8B6_9BACT|nr:FecR domain-containing protein [Echinicola jeungdonensis]MDN3669493.1 DUF4974 domain-containing protein [Echinicola jeungdonensis]